MEPLPAWKRARTKERAHYFGYLDGVADGRRIAEDNLKQREVKVKENEQRLSALRDICQTGSSVVECMTKALLSINGNL